MTDYIIVVLLIVLCAMGTYAFFQNRKSKISDTRRETSLTNHRADVIDNHDEVMLETQKLCRHIEDTLGDALEAQRENQKKILTLVGQMVQNMLDENQALIEQNTRRIDAIEKGEVIDLVAREYGEEPPGGSET